MAKLHSIDLFDGDQLRDYRKSRSLTQGDIAKKLNISVAYVSKLEKGEGKPNFHLRQKILELVEGGAGGEHRDPAAEEAAWAASSALPLEGGLTRREEQLVKMYRFLSEHNPGLAQTAYEDMVEAFLDARNAPKVAGQ